MKGGRSRCCGPLFRRCRSEEIGARATFGIIDRLLGGDGIFVAHGAGDAMALNMAGPPGQAASVVLQTTTATACLLADASHQGMQHQNAQQNADQFDKLASAYQACQQP